MYLFCFRFDRVSYKTPNEFYFTTLFLLDCGCLSCLIDFVLFIYHNSFCVYTMYTWFLNTENTYFSFSSCDLWAPVALLNHTSTLVFHLVFNMTCCPPVISTYECKMLLQRPLAYINVIKLLTIGLNLSVLDHNYCCI